MKPIKPVKHLYTRRAVFVFILLMSPVCVLLAQQRPFYDIVTKSDTYVPVSVEASSLFKRTPEEMDYARGRATINIPLYEIQTSSFTLPQRGWRILRIQREWTGLDIITDIPKTRTVS